MYRNFFIFPIFSISCEPRRMSLYRDVTAETFQEHNHVSITDIATHTSQSFNRFVKNIFIPAHQTGKTKKTHQVGRQVCWLASNRY